MGDRQDWSWMHRLSDTLPSHQAPECQACGLECVAPVAVAPEPHRYSPSFGPSTIYCQACGHTWTEPDVSVVALAWWGAGGHEQNRQFVRADKEGLAGKLRILQDKLRGCGRRDLHREHHLMLAELIDEVLRG